MVFCRSIAIAGGKWEELEGRSYEKPDKGLCPKPVLGHSGDNDSPIEMVGCADSRKWAYNILRYTTSQKWEGHNDSPIVPRYLPTKSWQLEL